MSEFRMPSLGADMEAGKLVEWLVKPGAALKHGDIIAVVETQKGAIEIEVFEDGVFERPLVDIGAKVPVGTPLAEIGHPGGAAPGETVAAPPVSPAPIPRPLAEAKIAAPPPAALPAAATVEARAGRRPVTPAARRLAEQSGVDLAQVAGTGPDGAVTMADVEAHLGRATAPTAPAGPGPAAPPAAAGMRASIAAAMAHAKRDIPHYYLAHTVDLTTAEAFLARINEKRGPAERLLLGALFLKAVALAAARYPEFNGHYEVGQFRASDAVHAGMAINVRGTGLVAPAIHDADRLSLDELMAAMRDLIQRVRAGRFRASELADPTITVSSLGERGVETLYPIIYPPQVAIVGFGMPLVRPWAVDGMIGARRVVSVTLAGDHRVSDGHRGALFVNAIEDLLTKPEAI